MRSFILSYDSATLVKTPATRPAFSASLTVSKPKCVVRPCSGRLSRPRAAVVLSGRRLPGALGRAAHRTEAAHARRPCLEAIVNAIGCLSDRERLYVAAERTRVQWPWKKDRAVRLPSGVVVPGNFGPECSQSGWVAPLPFFGLVSGPALSDRQRRSGCKYLEIIWK